MISGLTRLLNILIRSIGYSLRAMDLVYEKLPPYLSQYNLIRDVSSPGEADIIFLDLSELSGEASLKALDEVGSNSLLIILNSISNIHQCPGLMKRIIERGFVRSLLPIDNGIALFSRRGFDDNFLRRTVEVYRDSFIQGPNPIHYNTAYTLYNISKLILTRKRGEVVEIGAGRGFSTLWLTHAAKESNSHVTTLENRIDRVNYVSKTMRDLNLDKYVNIVCCDAKEYNYRDKDIILAFIDGRKSEYHIYLEAMEESMAPGALIIAHNTLSSIHEMKPYIEKVYGEEYVSMTVASDPAGITLSVYR